MSDMKKSNLCHVDRLWNWEMDLSVLPSMKWKSHYHSLHSATSKAVVEESSKLAECVGKTRSLLKKILSEGMDNCLTKLDNDPQGYLSQPLILLEAVLQECHNTFTACFHSFYPTPALQWACLCDLLNCLDQVLCWSLYIQAKARIMPMFFAGLRVGFTRRLHWMDIKDIIWCNNLLPLESEFLTHCSHCRTFKKQIFAHQVAVCLQQWCQHCAILQWSWPLFYQSLTMARYCCAHWWSRWAQRMTPPLLTVSHCWCRTWRSSAM